MSQQRLYIANAFSLGMLTSKEAYLMLMVKEVDIETAKSMLRGGFISAIELLTRLEEGKILSDEELRLCRRGAMR